MREKHASTLSITRDVVCDMHNPLAEMQGAWGALSKWLSCAAAGRTESDGGERGGLMIMHASRRSEAENGGGKRCAVRRQKTGCSGDGSTRAIFNSYGALRAN